MAIRLIRLLILLRYTLQTTLVVYCVGHLILSLAHADERWLNRYTIHPQHCHLVDNPDNGLVSGPAPQVCARPQRQSEPAGARPGLLDPTRPERSFAK